MLEVKNITKKFAGVTALNDVSLSLQQGKVSAIIGENGAGKSTLMKILSGVYQDFEGEIFYKGQHIKFENPRDALNQGIAIIHQELNLVPQLNITENIFLGRELRSYLCFLNKKEMRAQTKQLLDRLKLFVDPDTPVGELKVGQQQVVEIAKALLTNANVIIMDEPTSAISDSEVEVLFDVIKNLRSDGKTIAYISHKLDELFKIADNYIVIRDGCFIDSGLIADINQDGIIRKMVGRDVRVIEKKKRAITDKSLLSIKNLSLKHPSIAGLDILKNISFNLGKGEILGIYGLMGAGRTELLETLFGLNAAKSQGEIYIENNMACIKSPSDAIKSGLALVPEDRKENGLILNLDVKTNLSLPILKELERYWIIDERKDLALSEKYIRELNIKTPSERQYVKNLSGGNQQKVVIGKWLSTQPKILMLDEPTRGIDVNAKNEIYKLILSLADEGLGLIIVSSEIPEILALSDRILTMSEGVITSEFLAAEATEDKLLKASIPKTI